MSKSQQFTDMIGRTLIFDFPPQRIISLVPSITELLFELGLGDKIVGCTKFCVHPENAVRNTIKIGGTKKLNVEKIHSLRPDLIIANKEENEQEDVERLAQTTAVWVSEVSSFESALQMINQIGEITDTISKASSISNTLNILRKQASSFQERTALYFIWRKPYMLAGNDTFITDMMSLAGFRNIIEQARYPGMNDMDLIQYNPEFVLLSSEPYPFNEKHLAELQQIFPHSKIVLVDGEYFSWYGSRLLNSFEYFNALRKQIS
jgi:ABC-type Fe3+-hydroxamate transport system substrate-binding protein